MKKNLWIALLLFPLLSWSQEHCLPKIKKYYVDPTQIGFSQTQILIHFEEEWQPVRALFSDEKGLYIIPEHFPWTCQECNEPNPFWRSACKTPDCPGRRPPKYTLPKPPRPVLPIPYPLPPHLQKPILGEDPLT